MEPATSTTASTTTASNSTVNAATSPRKFTCKHCNKQFDLPTALGGHMTLHRAKGAQDMDAGDTTMDARVEQSYYHCKYCDKKFELSQALGGHMTSHRGERARDEGIMHEAEGPAMIDFFRNEEPLTKEVGQGSKSDDSEEIELTLRLGNGTSSTSLSSAVYQGNYGVANIYSDGLDLTLRL